MSLKFKIARWKFEVDWEGMTAEPIPPNEASSGVENRTEEINRKVETRGAGARIPANRRLKQTEQGEKEAWL